MRSIVLAVGAAAIMAMGVSAAVAVPGPLTLPEVPASVLDDVQNYGPTLSDGIWVVDPAGGIFASLLVDEANEDPNLVYTLAVPIDPGMFGAYTLLNEPDGRISDIFGVAQVPPGTGDLFLGFMSDTESVSPPYGPGTGTWNFVELPGMTGFWDATHYLDLGFQDNGYTAVFYSDVEVPEPAAAGVVLMGSAMLLRRRRQKAMAGTT